MSEIASADGRATVEQINDHFDLLAAAIQSYASEQVKLAAGNVFRVELDRNGLFDAYLAAFTDPAVAQDHNCRCCKDFLRVYGGLVTVDPETGIQRALIWDETIVPDMYKDGVVKMRRLVESAPIESVFIVEDERSESIDLGRWSVGGFHHFYLHLYGLKRPRSRMQTAHQAMAESIENYGLLAKSCGTFDPAKVEATRDIFSNDERLQHYPNHVGALTWFAEFQQKFRAVRGQQLRSNLLWYAVATKPLNFYRIGQTVVGEFLKSVSEGTSFANAKATFLRMVDPKDYMRPKAAPTEANIARAEQIVEKLGLASALRRRNATMADIQEFTWQPKGKVEQPEQQSGGVFAHLTPKGSTPDVNAKHVIDGGVMTWSKFLRKVLPTADAISFYIENTYAHRPYAGLVTAVDPNAAPLFTYDRDERRNPVSSYNYINGSPASHWGLRSGWVDVPGIIANPRFWHRDDVQAEEKNYLVLLEGGVDQRADCLAIFPQNLRPELHEVRATIEQFSNKGTRENADVGLCGYSLSAGGVVPFKLRVRSGNSITDYRIDRFD